MSNCRIIEDNRPDDAIHPDWLVQGDYARVYWDQDDCGFNGTVIIRTDTALIDLSDGGSWLLEDLDDSCYVVPIISGERVVIQGV